MKRLSLAVGAFALVAAISPAGAQETRATLTGHIADPTGATIPGATIVVTDTATGVKTTVTSNGAGNYTVPFLQPGPYKVEVSATGFGNYVHNDLVLQTEQTVTENVKLTVGSTSAVVTVEGAAPLVDTADATPGQTLSSEEVMDLPSNGRSPLGFARFEFGVVAKGKHAASQTTPFGNSTADDFSAGGGASASNELLLNGVPNMQDSSRTAGFSPQLDSVDAIRVDEFAANAALGDTSGGTVNITTKSGTNQFHGSANEYYSGSRPFQAKTYFTAPGTLAPSTHFNQFGGFISGPVWLPKIFNGRNKLFFSYAFEGYIGNAPASSITSVPTAAERTGDFSSLLTNTSSGQLYNPYSGVYASNVVTRQPITGNVFSNAGLTVSPVAAAYLAYVPLPNYTGPTTSADGENDYFANDPTTNHYISQGGRLDYDVTHSDRLSFEAHESNYANAQSNIFHNFLTGTTSRVVLWGGFAEDVHTFSPTLLLDVRAGLSRSENTSAPNSTGTPGTAFQYPGYLGAYSSVTAVPYLSFTDSAAVASLSGQPGSQAYFDTIQFFASLDKTIGRHSIKIGPDLRYYKNSTFSGSGSNGAFSFATTNSSGTPVVGTPITHTSTVAGPGFGGSLALFELGLPTSGSLIINPRYQYNSDYFAGFAQDDWKVLPNFTISAGIRFEAETPIVESQNRAVVGFNPSTVNASTAPAALAYAASPSSYLPASSFASTGALSYATSGHRNAYNTPSIYISPRIGFAWSPTASHGTLAIRGGFGLYVNPFNDYNAPQAYGYSATSTYLSNSSNQTNGVPNSSLSDPFNNSVNPIQLPYGSELGVNTNLGSGAIYFAPLHIPYTEKGSLDIEKQFGKGWLVEVSGFTTHAVHLSSSLAVSSIPLLPLLAHQNGPNAALTTALNTKITNPFKGTFPSAVTPNGVVVPNATAYNTGPTITVAQLLQSNPEYSSVTEQLVPNQNANFNAIMGKVQKRMSYGLQFDLNYEFSRQLGAQTTLNNGQAPAYGETSSDFPQHLTLTLIYQLPFGRGRMFMHDAPRWADEAVGGWQITSIYQALSGTPISWGNANYTGNFSNFNNHPHQAIGPSFNTAGFDTLSADQPNSYNYRTFPGYLLRSDANNNFDFSILKNFTIGDHIVVQPRVDAFNALNHVQFGSANVSPTASTFSDVSSQLNSPRQLQGGIHILF
jgi:hypothetical protein